MNALIVVTLKTLMCFVVVTEDDVSFERVLANAEQAQYITLDAYQTALPINTLLVTGTQYEVQGDVFTCAIR